MKKTMLLLTVLLSFVFNSCNKDDDGDGERDLQINNQNLAGIWYYETVIRASGSIPYPHDCTTIRDYVQFFVYSEIDTFNYYSTCDNYAQSGCDGFQIIGTTISACQGEFDDAIITRLTDKTLQVAFEEPRAYPQMSPDNVQVTGIIFKRQ